MHNTTVLALFTVLTTACSEWDIVVTTMGGDTALTTIVTAGESLSVGGEASSSMADTGSTGGVPTTGDAEPGTVSVSETTIAVDDTTTSTDSTTSAESESTSSSTGDGVCECGPALPGFCEAVDVMCRTMGLDGTLSDPPDEDKCDVIFPWCQTNGLDCGTCFLMDEVCRKDLPSPDSECVWVVDACESIRCTPPIAPVPDPPLGCARFIELSLHGPMTKRHVVIDTAACDRGVTLQATLDLQDGDGPQAFDLPPGEACATYGGPDSVASNEPGGVVVPTLTPNITLNEYTLTLLVDGELSDDVQVPAMLIGQQWKDAPTLSTPVRRHADFSWRVGAQHVAGCVI